MPIGWAGAVSFLYGESLFFYDFSCRWIDYSYPPLHSHRALMPRIGKSVTDLIQDVVGCTCPCDAIWRRKIWSTLVQMLDGTKLLPEPIMACHQWGPLAFLLGYCLLESHINPEVVKEIYTFEITTLLIHHCDGLIFILALMDTEIKQGIPII